MILSQFAEALALFGVISYALGLVIVNLALSEYGVSSLGMLRQKYLVAGLAFSLTMIAIAATSIPLALSISLVTPRSMFLVILEDLFLGVLAYVLIMRPPSLHIRPSLLFAVWYLGSIAFSALLVRVLAYPIPHPTDSSDPIVYHVLGLMTTVSFLIAQIAFYGRYLYGSRIIRERRPLFPGIFGPASVEILFFQDVTQSLGNCGLPLASPMKTATMLLVDETPSEVIVATPSSEGGRFVISLAKTSILGIRYLQ